MDPRKWLPSSPLFGSLHCVYCCGIADTFDHTPPRSLLPRPFPDRVQAMTLPACASCNGGFSQDEVRTAAVVCTVSFTTADRQAIAPGGWLHTAFEKDASLRDFISSRLGADGIFRTDQTVVAALTRIMTKTTLGLLVHEFGRLVRIDDIRVVAIEHTKNVNPLALVELHRRDDSGWAEVTPSGRELERQVFAVLGHEPPNMPSWRAYVPEYFEYMFIRRASNKLLTVLKIHDAIVVLLEVPWPTRSGPRRGGRPKRKSKLL